MTAGVHGTGKRVWESERDRSAHKPKRSLQTEPTKNMKDSAQATANPPPHTSPCTHPPTHTRRERTNIPTADIPDADVEGLCAVIGLDLLGGPRDQVVLAGGDLNELDVVVHVAVHALEVRAGCVRASRERKQSDSGVGASGIS